jgi:GNAT superfamily N-acetyltransferase
MIKQISWDEILFIWSTKLWPNRKSAIETNSAMCYLEGFDMKNMQTPPTFLGYFKENNIVGVNSGHGCANNNYRSRGLWVDPNYRNQGIGTSLLLATIDQAIKEQSEFIWSFPRYSSRNTYKSAGFTITGDWLPSETSEQNAYCIKKLV